MSDGIYKHTWQATEEN